MNRPSSTLVKFQIELRHPFSGLCSVEPVQNDIVHGRWLPRE
jgi:hypothetical protein